MDEERRFRATQWYAYILWAYKCRSKDQPNTPESNWAAAEMKLLTGRWPEWLESRNIRRLQ